MTDVYDETLRLTLQRDLDAFQKAGMTEEVGKVKKRLAGLDQELATAEEPAKPKAKSSSKAKEG